tara:strand:+ start:199 stop:525 length:327 start_codon:yes stop_codon:yes gene_type:complete
MAQTYKVSGVSISSASTYTNIYTCPSDTTALINSIYIGNTGTGDDGTRLRFNDISVAKNYEIMTNILVPTQATIQPLSAPLVLEGWDSISGYATSGFLDVVVNVLEIT